MKFLAASLIVFALSATALPSGAKADASAAAADAGKAALETVEAFHAALDGGDGSRAAALLAEDLIVFEGGHAERTKAEYAQGHLPADMAFSREVRTEVTASSVRTAGEVAVVMRETRTTGAYNGKPVDSIGVETMVLRRGPGGWLIQHIHWSSRKVAPAA